MLSHVHAKVSGKLNKMCSVLVKGANLPDIAAMVAKRKTGTIIVGMSLYGNGKTEFSVEPSGRNGRDRLPWSLSVIPVEANSANPGQKLGSHRNLLGPVHGLEVSLDCQGDKVCVNPQYAQHFYQVL